MRELVLAVLCLGAGVFGASAASKLRGRAAFAAFRAGLRATGLVPERRLGATAITLVAAECAVAAACLAALCLAALGLAAAALGGAGAGAVAGAVAGAALVATAVLTGVLACGVGVVVRRGTRARCACFGAGSGRPLGVVHLVRNAFLLLALAAGLVADISGAGPGAGTGGWAGPAGALVAAVAGSVASVIFVRWDDLADLFAPVPG